MNLQQMLVQHRCQKDLQQFGRTSFNAVGKIRVSFVDGSVKYCTGTLIGDNTVITSGECVYRENVVIFQFQPSWECDDVWLQFSSVYIPDKWVATNETNNFAIFYLRDPLKNAPRIGFYMAAEQAQQCYITLLGWNLGLTNKPYKMVTCPNLPDVKEKLGIESKDCGDNLCDLDDMSFQTGSPIVLTCPNPSIKHTVIGVLYMRKDEETKAGGPIPSKTFAFPYMFNKEDYQDIRNRTSNTP
eukprot:TRINITY_DN21336_c0_g1_i7.p1 TRINITY_DN21336_c0_g1~~TRINITY_DN21336_c0_g1_i7.p1  ORF type:complete len:242 (+),score=28.77 TRINITY_DN21336_c0_g1_i7:647-1372(+)